MDRKKVSERVVLKSKAARYRTWLDMEKAYKATDYNSKS